MTTSENKKIHLILTIVFSIIVCSFFSAAQTEGEAIDKLVLKLKQKVLLNNEQSDFIKTQLTTYFKDPLETKLDSLKARVESVLDEKQKAKYKIIKDDWWQSVTKELVNSKRKE